MGKSDRQGSDLARRLAAVVLIQGFMLAACTDPPLREEPAPENTPAPRTAPSPAPTPSPASDIQFLLSDVYPAGHRVVVRIKNIGNVTYRYQPIYQACFLSYFDSEGRKFLIPPGTHCDILTWLPIKPGQTKRLFTWDLDECTKDLWGCSRSRPLEPGLYTMQGVFKPQDGGSATRAEVTFEIRAA
jgi:hypothetical protein